MAQQLLSSVYVRPGLSGKSTLAQPTLFVRFQV
jgi:hypothetical protein